MDNFILLKSFISDEMLIVLLLCIRQKTSSEDLLIQRHYLRLKPKRGEKERNVAVGG